MLNGMAKPAAGLYPPGDPLFGTPKEHYEYDPEKAKACSLPPAMARTIR